MARPEATLGELPTCRTIASQRGSWGGNNTPCTPYTPSLNRDGVFPMPDRSPPGVIIPTMKLLHTLRTMVTRLELTDRHRPREDDIYPLTLKPGTLVVADPNGEEHLFDGRAIINLDRSLTIIERGEVIAYFPEGCFHVGNVD